MMVLRLLLIGLAVSMSSALHAAAALVDSAWLGVNLNAPGVVILDIQDAKDYKRFHAPGAVNVPYSAWRTSGKTGLPGMLPDLDRLEQMLGGLGISPQDQIVITATGRGASDLAASARVFWTLKVLGHEKVAVLNGGLVDFSQQGHRLESGHQSRPRTEYQAQPDASLMLSADDAKASLDVKGQFVDARSEGEFVGLYKGDAKERAGTVPGSVHLPHDWVTVDGSARLRDIEELQRLFAARGVAADGGQVHFCHSGNRAALTWFAAYAVLGNERARLYDGSMMEWSRRKDLPMEAKIKLCDSC